MKESLKKPKVRIQDLDGEARSLMMAILKEFIEFEINRGSFSELLAFGGREKTEESIIELFNKGFLRVVSDGEIFTVQLYDGEKYIPELG